MASVCIVEHVDHFPTTAALAGLPVPTPATEPDLGGTSYAHLFTNPNAPHSAAAFSQYPRCWGAGQNMSSHNFSLDNRCANVHNTKFGYMGVRTQAIHQLLVTSGHALADCL